MIYSLQLSLFTLFNRLGKRLEANRPKSDFTIDVQHEVSNAI